ncbi:MAG: hypothetical protein GY807_23545 [Gammaproteobacteria bacterium]|nr:hypothetical protein [Gammaproteobacteria bacterium]
MRKKARSPAQKAATRKLVAFNKRRRSGTKTTRKTRRRNPTARPAMKTHVVQNSRRKPAARAVPRRRSNPAPRMTMQSIMNKQLMPALQGGVGALGLDFAWGMLPLPANLKTGQLRHVVKGVGALGLGWLAGNFMKPATAAQLSTGALTVVMHTALRETIQTTVPQAAQFLGEYIEGMGYYNAGEIVSPQYDTNDNNNMGQVPYGSPLTPMGMNDDNMSYYETDVEGDLMGMGVGVYE